MNAIEENAEEFRLNTLAIAGQSLEEKEKKIEELRIRVEQLQILLTRLSSPQVYVPHPQPAPAVRPAPRRWSVR